MTTHGAPDTLSEALACLHREDRTRLVAAIALRFHDLDLAEEAVDAVWRPEVDVGGNRHPSTRRRTGADHPLARLRATACVRATTLLRGRGRAVPPEGLELVPDPARAADARTDVPEIHDDRAALLAVICGAVDDVDDRVALTLRHVCGHTGSRIARALRVSTPTVHRRLEGGASRLAHGRGTPAGHADVLAFVHSLYSAGLGEPGPPELLRDEGLRLARVVACSTPWSAEATGLLALLLLVDARSDASVDDDGVAVPLEYQDRLRWDSRQLDEGLALARRSTAHPGAGRYGLRAAIAAEHARAATSADTDWGRIVVLYDVMGCVCPGPDVAFGRALALGHRDGPAAGLAGLDDLSGIPALERHHALHSARAAALERLGRHDEAGEAWKRARDRTTTDSQRAYLDTWRARI